MAFSAEELTAGLNPQNSLSSRERLTTRGRKQYPRKSNWTFGYAPLRFLSLDLGFCRMKLQAALCQARLKFGLKGLGFLLVLAVNQSIISIPTPRKVWMRPRHPKIERVMQEQVRQNRADNTTLRGATLSLSLRAVFMLHGRRQPSFDVEQRPFAFHMLPDSPQQKFVVDVVKQALDVEL